jgi:hypothetical protein
MLDAIKRLMGSKPPAPQWPAVADWAAKNKLRFKRTRDEDGFVIDGGDERKPWRLEWGPPQRAYIQEHELRLRMDLGLPGEWQFMLLSQPLLDMLERQTFERFTESTQTVIDSNTPEEMRWLAMYPKVNYTAPKPLRSRFGLVANIEAIAVSWLEGELLKQLEQAAGRALAHQPPFMLMILRGKVYLRTQMADPDVPAIGQLIALFETAVLQALRAASSHESEKNKSSGWGGSSGSTAWQTLAPDEPKEPPQQ